MYWPLVDRRWNTGQCDELQNTTDNNTDSFSSLSVSVFPVQLLLSAHWLNDLTEVLSVPKRLLRPESVLRIKSLLNPLCLPVINVYRQRAPTVFNQRAEEQTKSEDTFWLLWVYTDFYDGCFFFVFFLLKQNLSAVLVKIPKYYMRICCFFLFTARVACDCSKKKKKGYFIWQRSELNLEINIHII